MHKKRKDGPSVVSLNQMNRVIKQFMLVAVATIVVGSGVFGMAHDASAWYNSSWSYRKVLTIESGYSTGVATTTNAGFVVVASTTQTFLKSTGNGGKIAQGMGYDIIFVDSNDMTLLPFEYEQYTSSTGSLVAWVRVPDISSTTDRTIYMYYGNASATNNATSGATWQGGSNSTSTVAVWHLKENPAGAAPQIKDSTNHNNNGTSGGTMTASDQVVGQLDGSLDFDGTNDLVNCGSNFSLTNSPLTITALIYARTLGESSLGIIAGKDRSTTGWFSFRFTSAASLSFSKDYDTTDLIRQTANSTFSLNAWHYVVATWTGSKTATTARIFIDGVESTYITSTNGVGNQVSDVGVNFIIGNNSGGSQTFDGLISDVKVYNYVLTQADIKTIYNMKSRNDLFLTWGTEQVNTSVAQFTISAWVKPTTSIATKAIVVKDKAIRLVTDRSGKPACLINDGSTWRTGATSTTPLALDSWQYLSCAYDRSNIKVYLNGILQATRALSSVDIQNSTTTMRIGKAEWTSSGYGDFQGYVDEFKYYKYARTASQIKSDYTGVATKRGATARSVTIGEQNDTSDGLVAYWKMDETSWATSTGNTAVVFDSSGNGNNGTPHPNNVNTTSAAKFGMAGSFDGTDDYVDCGTNSSLTITGSNITIVAWVYWKAVSSYDTIIDKDRNYTIKIYSGNPYYPLFYNYNGGNIFYSDTVGGAIPLNTWTQIAIVLNGSTYTWYRNGVRTTTGVQTAGLLSDTDSLKIGTSALFTASTFWNGNIDDVKIYNKARTAEQIRRDYESGPPPIAHWKMDENTGQTAYDTSGSNNGTLGTGATTDSADPTWTNGKYGSALKFDGVNDYVSIANSLSNVKTVEFWANNSNTNDGLMELINNNTYVSIASNAITATNFSSATIYVDGVAGKTTITSGWHHIAVTTETGITASSIVIGEANNDYTSGYIDDVHIYNYARTSKQIVEDILAGSPASAKASAGAVSYWNLDEMQGTTAYDKLINKNDLTLSAAGWASSTQSCKFNGCWKSYGDRWLSKADDADFDFGVNQNFSISMWFKSNSATNPSATEFLIDKELSTAGYAIYAETDGDIVFGIDDDTTWTPDDTAGNISQDFYDGLWHHVVGVRATSTIEIYIDGTKTSSDTSLAATGSLENSDSLIIGSQDATNDTDDFNGMIDEVSIYRFALSPLEIKELFNKGASLKLGSFSTASDGATPSNSQDRYFCIPGDTSTCSPPVGWWKMDEKTGQSANDTSGNGNTGTLGAATTTGTDDPTWKSSAFCHSGSCLKFDGVDDYVNLPTYSPSNWSTNSLTICGWVNRIGTADTYFLTLYQYHALGNTQILIRARATEMTFLGMDNGTSIISITTDVPAVGTIAGQWTYVCFVCPRGENAIVYKNGVAYAGYSSRTCNTNAFTETANFTIGKYTTNYGSGFVDDVRIYNYARTPAQIAWDYNRGAPIAHWKMNDGQNTTTTCDGTGLTVKDSSGNGKTGTLYGATSTPATSWSEGKYSCGITFDGVNDYVKVGNTSRYDVRALSFWVKPDSTTQNIISLSATNTVAVSGGVVSANGFGAETIYVDGKQTTSMLNAQWHMVTIVSNSDIQATEVLLGRVGANYYAGILDDVRLYNYSPTSAQIKTIFNQGASVRFGPTEGLP